MKIPEFKPSQRFLDTYDIPCLVADVKNSELSGLATWHISECEEDPMCLIYLRGKESAHISAWQREILEQLFEKEGLAAAVTEGMHEYETSSKWGGMDYAGLAEGDRQRIKLCGIAPHVTASTIVIDEIKRKVIVRADTVIDGNLDEHGISIFLSKGRWRFETADYFNRYQSSPDLEYGLHPRRQMELRMERWQKLFPPTDEATVTLHGFGNMVGTWALDEQETKKVMRQMLIQPLEVDHLICNFRYYGLSISETMIRSFDLTPPHTERGVMRLVECERRGNRVFAHLSGLRSAESGYVESGYTETNNYWCDGQRLVRDMGLVYRPVEPVTVEVASKVDIPALVEMIDEVVKNFLTTPDSLKQPSE